MIRFVMLLTTLLLAAPAGADVGTDTLLGRLSEFGTMPEFRDYRAGQFSSYERNGGNGDAQHFLRMEGKTGVMAEMKGPGAIVRIWSANADGSGNLKITLDGAEKPVIDAPFKNLFNGEMPPFASPLSRLSSGGFISYLPIPYARSCRVTIDDPKGLYYQIGYVTFPEGTAVRSFQLPLPPADARALERTQSAWRAPEAPAAGLDYGRGYRVRPDETVEIGRWAGPGQIRAFGLRVDGVPADALRKLVLRGYFDDHVQPDIEAPVADFFGNTYGVKPFGSLFVGQTAQGMYCLLPMPFARQARFTLENGRREPVAVWVAADLKPGPFDPNRDGYLHALYLEEKVRRGEPHHWLNLTGTRGHFVGQVQAMSGKALGFLEGDEQFRVDDEQWLKSETEGTMIAPWNGTGTEDYYNSGWYFNQGPITLPTHGAVVREDDGRINVYRWHLLDTPTFRRSIDAQLEHGGTNDAPDTYYSSVVFWYGDGEAKPRFQMPKAVALALPRRMIAPPNNAALLAAAGAGIAVRPLEELSESLGGVRVLEAVAAAGPVKIPFTVGAGDRYTLTLYGLQAARYGELRAAVDGKVLGPALSFKGEGAAPQPMELKVGELSLASGSHTLELTAASPSAPVAVTGYSLASASPLITSWVLSGQYPNTGDQAGLDAVLEPEKHLENPVAAGQWRAAKAAANGRIDLAAQNPEKERTAAYALTEVTAPAAMKTELLLGSDDGIKVWLNGKQVHSKGAPRPLRFDEDVVPVELQAGRNVLLLKVVQGIGGWEFAARLRDPEGQLKIAAPSVK
jgi:hypothetical protein